jgi:hypothetical protein
MFHASSALAASEVANMARVRPGKHLSRYPRHSDEIDRGHRNRGRRNCNAAFLKRHKGGYGLYEIWAPISVFTVWYERADHEVAYAKPYGGDPGQRQNQLVSKRPPFWYRGSRDRRQTGHVARAQ